MRLASLRFALVLSLVGSSWHPAAAQAIGRAAGAAPASGVQPVQGRVAVPLSLLPGAGPSAPSLGVPSASLPGIGSQAGVIGFSSVMGQAAPVEAVPAIPPQSDALPSLGAPAVAGREGAASEDPTLPAGDPAPAVTLLGRVPASQRISRGLPGPGLPISWKARSSGLDRAESMVASLQAVPAGGDAGLPAVDLQAKELSKIYDGLVQRPDAGNAAPVEAGVQAGESRSSAPSFWSRLLPSSGEKKSSARRSIIGTGIFKIGMESLGVSIPMIALTMFGSAVWMANMAVTWGVSMTFASMLAGGWMDRKPVHKVMSRAMVVEAAAVAGILGLFLTGLGTPLFVMPLYAVAGAAMGVIVTGRNLLPAKVLGNDHASLGKFNAVTHLVYEVAGTIAPLLVGLLMSKVGLVSALFLHPPAFLLAAWMFSRIKLDEAPAAGGASAAGAEQGRSARRGLKAALSDAFSAFWTLARNAVSDVKAGSRVMLRDRGFRWVGVMLLGPMIIHRVFESMLVPFFVKSFLGAPQLSAWVVSGSNFGELLGALLLIRAMTASLPANATPEGGRDARPSGLTASASRGPSSPYRWIKPMALGTLAVWSMVLTGNLWAIIPLTVVMSLTWAANDINLTSYLQSRLPEESAGKAMGFLMAAELAAIFGISYVLGFMFDSLPPIVSLVVVNAAFTLLAAVFWRGKKHLKAAAKP